MLKGLRNLKRALGKSMLEAKCLQPRYRRLSTLLGFISVAIACFFMVVQMYYSRIALDLPLEGGSLEGIRLQFLLWVLSVMVSVPIIFYASMVITCGVFGTAMLIVGKFNGNDLKNFALYAKHPKYWFSKNA